MGKIEEEQALLSLLHAGALPHDLEFPEQLSKKLNELFRTNRLFPIGNKKMRREVLGAYLTPLGRAIAKYLVVSLAREEIFAARIRHIDFDDTVTLKDFKKFRRILRLFLLGRAYERAKARFRKKK